MEQERNKAMDEHGDEPDRKKRKTSEPETGQGTCHTTIDKQEKVSDAILEELRDMNRDEMLLRILEMIETEDLNTIEGVLKNIGPIMKIKEPSLKNKKSLLEIAIEYREGTSIQFSKISWNELAFEQSSISGEKLEEVLKFLNLIIRLAPEYMNEIDGYLTLLRVLKSDTCENSHRMKVMNMLLENNVNVNAKDEYNRTPLYIAASHKPQLPELMEIIRQLIKYGANPDAIDSQGRTFLHVAASNVHRALFHEIIVYLDSIRKTNCFTIACGNGSTVLHTAVFNSEILHETLDLFKKNGSDFNARTNSGDSILITAIRGGRSGEFINHLTQLGANWNATETQHDSPLHHAAFWGNLSAVKLFIQWKCDVNAKNTRGNTPLHKVLLGQTHTALAIVTELVNNRADLNIKNDTGDLPVDLARKLVPNGKLETRTLRLIELLQNLNQLTIR
ncbi:unnamed protein product [Orchesella dallaii]|uniref:Uncharacterized protein n=1 Tax=Orchesella dallaii TaxID=48710 RepID=A0ABP1Q7Z7_9HEXA